MLLVDLNEEAKEKVLKGLGLSLTKIKTFDGCNYKYYLQYILKEPYDKAAFNPKYFKIGQFAHKWIESEIKGVVCDFDSSTLTDEDKQKTIGNCAKVFQNEYIKSIIDKGEPEKEFSLYITPTESDGLEAKPTFLKNADFHGYIDYYAKIGDTIHIIDWKTGGYKKNTDDDTFMQLFLYAKACQKLDDGNNFVLSYYYLDHAKIVTQELSISELDAKIEAVVKKGITIPTKNDESLFPASPSWACKLCPYSKVRSSDNIIPCKFTIQQTT
jgi:ATP-dependent exoDNAse (exonuclease V) beta subunit